MTSQSTMNYIKKTQLIPGCLQELFKSCLGPYILLKNVPKGNKNYFSVSHKYAS